MTDISMTSASIPARGASKTKRKQSSVAHDRALTLLVFLPPALLLFTLFVILPMGEAAWYSLYRWNGYGTPTDFVGLKNFQVLFGNAAFSQALLNNGLIILISVLIQIPLAIWLAMMLAHRLPGVVAFRLVFFLPYVLADVAAGLIWRFVYDGDYGLFAAISNFFGFANPYVLADKDVAIYAVLGVIVWKYFGFHMMLFIAGLQSVDKNVLEAAEIDGASGWQKFRYVTLPMLGSTVRLSVFCGDRLATAVRHDHAAHRRRSVQLHANHGHLSLHLRRHAHAGGAWQRGGCRSLRYLRDARLRLQKDFHAP